MARTLNLLSEDARQFGDGLSPGFEGWFVDGTGELILASQFGPTSQYDPTNELLIGNALICGGIVGSSLSAISPWVSCDGGVLYRGIATVLSRQEANVTVILEFENSDGVLIDAVSSEDGGVVSVTNWSLLQDEWGVVFAYAVSPERAERMRLKFTLSRNEDLVFTDFLAIYDPVLVEDGVLASGTFTRLVYSSLPTYLQEDDLSGSVGVSPQPPLPMFRLVELLTHPLSRVYDEAAAFEVVPSKLADPGTEDERYKDWMLSLLSGEIVYAAVESGVAWGAIEDVDLDMDQISGEWEDIELLENWIGLETFEVTELNFSEDKTRFIRTGSSGIHSGKASSVINILKEYSFESEADQIFVRKNYKGSHSLVQVFVPQGTILQAGVEFVARLVRICASIGTRFSITSNILRTADSFWFYDNLPGEDLDTSQLSFINDEGDGGRWLKFSPTAPTVHVGPARYKIGGAMDADGLGGYYSSSDGPNLSGVEKDIFVEVSDVEELSAGAVGAGSLDSFHGLEGWRFRERRHLVSGGSAVQWWGVYLVSGVSAEPDVDTRILYVQFDSSFANISYAFSDPVDVRRLNNKGTWFVRVSVDDSGDVSFYASNDIFDLLTSVGGGSVSAVSAVSGSQGVYIGAASLPHSIPDYDMAGTIHRVALFPRVWSNPVGSSEGQAVVNGNMISFRDTPDFDPVFDFDLESVPLNDFGSVDDVAGGVSLALTDNSTKVDVIRASLFDDSRRYLIWSPTGQSFRVSGVSSGDQVTFRAFTGTPFSETVTTASGTYSYSATRVSQDPYIFESATVVSGGETVELPAVAADSSGVVSSGGFSLTLPVSGSSGVFSNSFYSLTDTAFLTSSTVPIINSVAEFSLVCHVSSNGHHYSVVSFNSGLTNSLRVYTVSNTHMLASYTDGQNTETLLVATDVSQWLTVVVRHDLIRGLSLDVKPVGGSVLSASVDSPSVRTAPMFTSGALGRSGVLYGYLGWFDRRLSDTEVDLVWEAFES